MHQSPETPTSEPTKDASVLANLRALLPNRRLGLHEALRVAEVQATRLLQLQDCTDVPVPYEVVSDLPRISVEYDPDLPRHAASGSSHWNAARKTWIICLNADEPTTRQRFTLMHEYKHIIDHYHPGLRRQGLPRTVYGLDPVEYIAEYFAGCVLMPRTTLKAAYGDGVQRISELAELFDVSRRAMEVRLSQIGLAPTDEKQSARPARYRLQPQARATRRGYYHRPLSRTLPRKEAVHA